MVLRLKLVRPPKPLPTWNNELSQLSIWKNTKIISLRHFVLFIEIICILIYMNRVLIPSTMVAYHTHVMFVTLFYLEDHEAPVYNVDALNDYYSTLNETANRITGNFLSNVTFPNKSQLINHKFDFVNGSSVYVKDPQLDPTLLKKVKTITTTLPMYIISEKKKVPGCSKWTLTITVSMVDTDPAFWLSTKVYRSQCPLQNPEYKIDHEHLEYYVWTRRTIFPLLLLLVFHIILDIVTMRQRLRLHNTFYKTDHKYKQMPSRKQLHFTLGWWLPVELIVIVGTLISSIFVFYDSAKMSELPSLSINELFSIACFFHLGLFCQYFAYTKVLYLFVLIIRDGIGLLFHVQVGSIPFLFAAILGGIFMFASIATKTRSFWGMYEIVNSFEFSNNIENMYNEFSDGTPLFNWLAFGYITLVVLISGWVVLASCMSAALCVHSTIQNKQKRE